MPRTVFEIISKPTTGGVSSCVPLSTLVDTNGGQGMYVLDETDKKRPKLGPATDAEGRLPRGRALLVIAALSVLSWAVVIALFMALRAIL
jgi:hypothetical protein